MAPIGHVVIVLGFVPLIGMGFRLRHDHKTLNSGASGRTSSRLSIAIAWGVAVVIMVTQGCETNQGPSSPEKASLSWDSPRLRAIKAELHSLYIAYDNDPKAPPKDAGKERCCDLLVIRNRLFRERLSAEELGQLARSCQSLPMQAIDRDGFDNGLLEFMIKTFVASGDRQSLVKLLATRCVTTLDVGYSTIESFLASRGKGPPLLRIDKMKDPILVLGEAYSECGIPEVRQELAFAVRRGFGGQEISGKDDADFVNNAMRWYQEHKDRLVVNDRYSSRVMREQPLERFLGNVEEYERRLDTTPDGRRELLLYEKSRSASREEKFECLLFCFPLWFIHAIIATVLTAPFVFFGRKRVHWRRWELLAFVLPFAVWAILTASEFAGDAKTQGNVVESWYLAVAVPLAAMVRITVGPRSRERVWAMALIVTLCVIAAVVFFVVPAVPGVVWL